MKKILLGLFLLIVLAAGAVYLFIPSKLELNATATLHAALPGVSRSLENDNNWDKWWPGKTPFSLNDKRFVPGEKIYNSMEVKIIAGDIELLSRIDLLLIKADSMKIEWHTEQATGTNPLKRFSIYRQAKSIQHDMNTILAAMKSFLLQHENIYGIKISERDVIDSVLISTKKEFNKKPGPADVDEMISQLKKYIATNGAIEKNYPMLNVLQLDRDRFETMVAIPVDRRLPDTKEFAAKFLLKGGNVLEAEVKGGPAIIDNAFNELENFRADYKYTSPAIPYQLLVTDRKKETDTTKWITKLYYPVF